MLARVCEMVIEYFMRDIFYLQGVTIVPRLEVLPQTDHVLQDTIAHQVWTLLPQPLVDHTQGLVGNALPALTVQ